MALLSGGEANSLVLGTALWGWKVNKEEAFSLLDSYISLGGRLIDTAVNYPINKKSEDMGLAARWIGEWLAVNPSADIEIWYKLGAIDNLGSSEVGLSYDQLSRALCKGQEILHKKISIVGVHWDNRAIENFTEIKDTLRFFRGQAEQGYKIALSGIKSPHLYNKAWPEGADNWFIQVKDNVLTSDARKHYSACFPRAKYYAYGINMGGVKSSALPTRGSSLALRGLAPQDVVKRIEALINKERVQAFSPKNLNEFALMRAFLIPQISGVVLGPSSVKQLEQSAFYWKNLPVSVNEKARHFFREFL
ncbi:aldo/keto reductase [Marinagarivorans algicola]|uniref:aldo/keto reductase n=1 Tax=Marinagarivorans algicola TaxID=1513270 RepID=UPI0006B89298|nr:aldo/keto reductase [Marinagarivorans algicola]